MKSINTSHYKSALLPFITKIARLHPINISSFSELSIMNVGFAPPPKSVLLVICLASSSVSLTGRQIARLCTCRGLFVDTYIPERSSCGCILTVNRRLDIRETVGNFNCPATARVPTRNVGEIRQQDRSRVTYSQRIIAVTTARTQL